MEVVELEGAVLRCARLRAHSRQHVCVWDSSPLSKHTPEAPGHESLLLLIAFFIYIKRSYIDQDPPQCWLCSWKWCSLSLSFGSCQCLSLSDYDMHYDCRLLFVAVRQLLPFWSAIKNNSPSLPLSFFFPLSSYMKALAPHICLFSAAWALVNEPDLNEAFKAFKTCYAAKAVCYSWGHFVVSHFEDFLQMCDIAYFITFLKDSLTSKRTPNFVNKLWHSD